MYVDVAIFGRQAEACAKHLRKGRLVAVSGQLRYSQWRGPDGQMRSKHSIAAQLVEFLDPKGSQQRESEPAAA
jgi:single-strand DNA-binding protein